MKDLTKIIALLEIVEKLKQECDHEHITIDGNPEVPYTYCEKCGCIFNEEGDMMAGTWVISSWSETGRPRVKLVEV